MADETRQNPIPEGCPEPEAIAAYLDGRLAGAEKGKMEAHLASCQDCYAIFAESARSETEARGGESASPVARPRFGRRWIGLATVAAVIAAAVPSLLRIRARHNARPDVAELVAAVGAERPFEPRVTGGFQFGPMKPVYRSASPAENESWELLAAAAKIRKKSEQNDTVQALADLGVAQLLLSKYDDAVSSLEEASLRAPKDARVLTDLSAAYLVRAKEKDRADDYPKALEAAEKATELDPKILEAWFNRAYALETLYLKGEAIKAWKDYLDRDMTSAWAAEARRRRDVLLAQPNHAQLWSRDKPTLLAAAAAGDRKTVENILRENTQETRELLETDLLPACATTGSWRSEDKPWRVAVNVSRALSEVCGDRFASDVIENIERVQGRDNKAGLETMAKGIELLGRAESLYFGRRMVEAVGLWSAAEALLNESGSPLMLNARLFEASTEFNKGDLKGALAKLDQIEPEARSNNYESLLGRCLWIRGLLKEFEGNPADALPFYAEAGRLFGGTHDDRYESRIEALQAQSLFDLGDLAQSDSHRITEFKSAAASMPDSAVSESLVGASLADLRIGRYRTAYHGAREVLSSLPPEATAARLVAQMALGGAALHRGFTREGEEEFAKARKEASSLDALVRYRLEAEIETNEADAELPMDALRHLRLIEETGNALRRAGLKARESEFYLLRGRARQALKDPVGAQADFLAGIKTFEAERQSQGEWEISYFDRSWQLFDRSIELALSRRDEMAALGLLERSHAMPQHRSEKASRWDLDQVREALPRSTVLVYFALLNPSAVAWLVTSQDEKLVSIGTSDAVISSVRRFQRASFPDQRRASCEDLFDLLVRPLLHALPPSGRLIIVPDGPLGLIPFGDLSDRTDHRELRDRFSTLMAFSGGGLRRDLVGHRRESSLPPSILFVHGPSGGDVEGATLPALAGVEADEAEISKAFPGVDVLRGREASAGRFLAEAARHEIVYFAGHAVASDAEPGLARLVLESDAKPGVPTYLYARDIAKADLSRVRLVILAACHGGLGFEYRLAGPQSIARAFLAAGAREVVASNTELTDSMGASIATCLSSALRRWMLAPRGAAARSAAGALFGDRASVSCFNSQNLQVWTGG